MVIGNKNASKLLEKAIQISEPKYDIKGRPYQAVSTSMEELLGISGSIQMSITPRFIRGEQKYQPKNMGKAMVVVAKSVLKAKFNPRLFLIIDIFNIIAYVIFFSSYHS